jgi:DedD protein
MKTYVHVAETPEGRRIRVRAGPFVTRAEAEKAAAKIKSLGLSVAILTL